MMQSFDDADVYGREFMDAGLKSFAALSKGLQAMAIETTDYAKSSFEGGSLAIEKMISAGSPDRAWEVQADYAKRAYEGLVAQTTRMTELCADIARDSYKPFESAVANVK